MATKDDSDYLHGKPKSTPIGLLMLVHGWPDLSMGWRYQIPLFLELRYEVIVPDMMGYGGTVCNCPRILLQHQ